MQRTSAIVQSQFLKQTVDENIDENGFELKKLEKQIQDVTNTHAKEKHVLKRKMNYQ